MSGLKVKLLLDMTPDKVDGKTQADTNRSEFATVSDNRGEDVSTQDTSKNSQLSRG